MKKNIKYYIILICIYIFIFQNLIQSYIPIFHYFDELFALSIIPVFIVLLVKNKGKFTINRIDKYIILFLLIIFTVGIIANIKYRYQPIKVVFSDVLLVYKFFLAYFLSKLIMKKDFIDKYSEKYNAHVKIIICILFVLTILNYIFKIWKSEIRYGIMSNRLFYGHPTGLAAVCIFLIACLFLFSSNGKMESNKLYLYFTLIMLFSTMRMKAVVATIIILIIIVYVNNNNKKISFSKMGILALIGIILAWNQIEYYYVTVSNGGARAELTNTAIKIAKDYFPIGTGFGTYASYFSGEYYSPLYYKYNLNNVWGITENEHPFISDTFWPMILGQFGIIGTICYVIILILLFLNIQKSFEKNNNGVYIAKLSCFVYLLISSTSESAFVHTMAIMLALIIGAYSRSTDEEILNENKLLGGKNAR